MDRGTTIQTLSYLLGLFISPSLSVSLAIIFVAVLNFVLIPALWPGKMLDDVDIRVKATRAHLDDEAHRRKTADMHAISARGLQRLDAISIRAHDLSDQHRVLFRPTRLHRYIPAAYRICKDSRRCRQDLDDLVWEIDEEIIRLDLHVDVAPPQLTTGANHRHQPQTRSRFHASTPLNEDIV